MTESRVAKRYAKALFNIALKQDMLASVDDDLKALTYSLSNSESFRRFMSRPEVTPLQKKELLSKTLGDKITGLTSDFVKLLIDKRRDDQLLQIQLEFADLKLNHDNVVRAVIASSEELSDAQKKAIIEKMAAKVGRKLEAEFEVDPHLMGGIKVTYDNYVLDGSVRGHLNKLREKILYDLLKQA